MKILGFPQNPTFSIASITSDVVPAADNTYKLGSATFRWSDLRAMTGTISGNLNVGGVTAIFTVKPTSPDNGIVRIGCTGGAADPQLQFVDNAGTVIHQIDGNTGGIWYNMFKVGGGFRIRDLSGNECAHFDADSTAGNTRMQLWDVTAGALVRVSRGAADSGGVGFRLLRVPN